MNIAATPQHRHASSTTSHPKRQCATCRHARGKSQAAPEDIRTRSFEIYRTRIDNGAPGDECSDWLQAERELNEHVSTCSREEQLMKGDQE